MELKLRDVEYKISQSTVELTKKENSIYMSIDIYAETNDASIDYEIKGVQLYNEGFNTKTKSIDELKGKKFAWDKSINSDNEEAGVLNVVEFERVTKGTIEVIDIDEKNITIRWTGTGNIYWSEPFSKNVPFDVEFTTDYILK
jgi:hypothetical protein